MKTIILASQSPRRSQLLEKAGISFQTIALSTSEFVDKKLIIDAQILSITRQKLEAAEKSIKVITALSPVVICADTEVIFENKLQGKPNSKAHAQETLSKLSGRMHLVKTAYIIKDMESQWELSHIETSLVYFKKLSVKTIDDYIETGEPMDKAGSYGIQGLGSHLIEKYDGLFSNIVGLPIEKLIPHLQILKVN
ncbi:MAG: Maf family protein [Bdellovibrionaceae bacterium]|nr:Maf family protein [Pseudobdellovibrionaceae bacterium]NUM60115.1 septum formation protein Maf [Pseudobdellovibrionaceae bacterium]